MMNLVPSLWPSLEVIKHLQKGGVFPDWNERAEWRLLKHRDLWQPLCRLLITANPFIKHSILHRWRPKRGVGGRHGMSGHLTWTPLEEISLWAETQSSLLIPSYMFFCISGHVVQDPHCGRCSFVFLKVVLQHCVCVSGCVCELFCGSYYEKHG